MNTKVFLEEMKLKENTFKMVKVGMAAQRRKPKPLRSHVATWLVRLFYVHSFFLLM